MSRSPKDVLRALLVVTAAASAMPSTAFAQCPDVRPQRPLWLAGGRYDVPLRATGSVGLLVPLWNLAYGDPGCTVPAYRGLIVDASIGAGGTRLGVGLGRRTKQDGQPTLFGQDLLVSILRTDSAPQGSDPASTYVGVEAGLTVLAVRWSAGVAHRVGSTGTKATIFTWSGGVQIGW